jgi:hypothetical protein
MTGVSGMEMEFISVPNVDSISSIIRVVYWKYHLHHVEYHLNGEMDRLK